MEIAKVGLEQKPGPGLGAAMNLLMSEGGDAKRCYQ